MKSLMLLSFLLLLLFQAKGSTAAADNIHGEKDHVQVQQLPQPSEDQSLHGLNITAETKEYSKKSVPSGAQAAHQPNSKKNSCSTSLHLPKSTTCFLISLCVFFLPFFLVTLT